MRRFKQLDLPLDGEFSSDDRPLPIEFFLTVLPSATEAYLKLGYFSSSAIQVLAYGFAQFIANGGVIHVVTNHFLYERDKELLAHGSGTSGGEDSSALLRDPEWVYEQLTDPSKHVLDCLKHLANAGRLKLVPVMLSPAKMVHFKEGVFLDKEGHMISFIGSCNFTGNGLVENGESLSIARSWVSEAEDAKCKKRLQSIISITNKENKLYEYLKPEDVVNAALNLGHERPVDQLLDQERKLLASADLRDVASSNKYLTSLEEAIKNYKSNPRFPYAAGPRAYQEDAYSKWLENDRCGIFAMATGTGKTITSLNCLLHVFNDEGYYQAVILVPTKALMMQWQQEVGSFNFSNIITAFSGNNRWAQDVGMLETSLSFNPKTSFVLISTYDTIVSPKLLSLIAKLPSSTLLIADEAHNFGREGIKSNVDSFPFGLRIALSATPERQFDDDGNKLIETFFKASAPYTYSFSMKKAISDGVLCHYDYFPHVVELTQDEMQLYAEISLKLAKLFDHQTGAFYNKEYAKILLLERRRVIHKATNKQDVFRGIICELEQRDKLAFSFVYAPEGEGAEGENLLNVYMSIYEQEVPNRRAHHFTSETENRAVVMEHFERQNIDTLFSMKCLDEGVDIPRAEVAIFCSSTGNPRQFIQRRGRVLRQHPLKERAIIHDLVVVPIAGGAPEVDFSLERKLITEELRRVVYFATLARNYGEIMRELQPTADKYGINLYAMEQELMEQ